MRAKYIVVSNSSLFEAGARGIASVQPPGDWPLWPLLVKGRGLNGPLIQPKSGGGGWGKNRPVIRHSVGLGRAQSLSGLPGACGP